MKNNVLTYGQLYEKLKSLGFRQRAVEIDNKRAHVFEHTTAQHAMIVLPQRNENDKVEPFYLNGVTATLRAHGLADDSKMWRRHHAKEPG